jgi:hypothetical protein
MHAAWRARLRKQNRSFRADQGPLPPLAPPGDRNNDRLSPLIIKEETTAMPQYFFHLSFGNRRSPDDEGVELPDRSAAREEAFAVIRELCDPALNGNPRRWAGWFLQVADARGPFLRAPIGHPALELVTEGWTAPPAAPSAPQMRRMPEYHRRIDELASEMEACRSKTAALLEKNRLLREDIARTNGTCAELKQRARSILQDAQRVQWSLDRDYRDRNAV